MTLGEVFVRWMKLAGVVILLAMTHLALHLEVAPRLAEVFAPPYAPLSAEDALTAYRAAGRDNPCWSSSLSYQLQCEAGLLGPRPAAATNSPPDLEYEHRLHRERYEATELHPLTKRIRIGIAIFFVICYAAIALDAMWCVKRWFTARGRSAIAARLSCVLWIPDRLKRFAASRSLRRAESELVTLVSLRQSGLITEEMFDRRKDALKAVLGDNHLLR